MVAHGATDFEDAFSHMQRFESDEQVYNTWCAYLQERARSLVWRHWRAWSEIKAVAAKLLERETLTAAEIMKIQQSAEDDEEMAREIYEAGNQQEDET